MDRRILSKINIESSPLYKDNLGSFNLFKKIVFICDDSESMNGDTYNDDNFNIQKSRFNEMRDLLSVILQFLKSRNDLNKKHPIYRCDVRFINRIDKNLFDLLKEDDAISKLETAFNAINEGNGPKDLTKLFNSIIAEANSEIDGKILVIMFTDMEIADLKSFRNAIERTQIRGHEKAFVSLVALAKNEKKNILNEWDQQIRHFDVTYYYEAEKKIVEGPKKFKTQQSFNREFTHADYFTKILFGSVVQSINLLDKN